MQGIPEDEEWAEAFDKTDITLSIALHGAFYSDVAAPTMESYVKGQLSSLFPNGTVKVSSTPSSGVQFMETKVENKTTTLVASPLSPFGCYVVYNSTKLPCTYKASTTLTRVRMPLQFEARGMVDVSTLPTTLNKTVHEYSELMFLSKVTKIDVEDLKRFCIPYREDSLCSHTMVIVIDIKPTLTTPAMANAIADSSRWWGLYHWLEVRDVTCELFCILCAPCGPGILSDMQYSHSCSLSKPHNRRGCCRMLVLTSLIART